MNSDNEVYEEDDCMTDDEEEVAHDHVRCKNCGVSTHISAGHCKNENCKTKFKFSASGYLIDGEDGDFICDDDEDPDSMSEEEEEEETEFDSEMDTDEETESSDSEEDMVTGYDYIVDNDECEFVPKKNVTPINENTERRVTRSQLKKTIC